LLDRIDMQVEMACVSFREMSLLDPAEDSLTVSGRVAEAWERQRARFAEHPRVLTEPVAIVPVIAFHPLLLSPQCVATLCLLRTLDRLHADPPD
jgi:hypothetical protein